MFALAVDGDGLKTARISPARIRVVVKRRFTVYSGVGAGGKLRRAAGAVANR